MRKVLLSVLCLGLVISVSAQKVYFIYIQSEKGQPFFAKLNDKVLSSAASGYLIISKLLDSTYTLRIGSLQNEWPEQKFTVSIYKKDHGYLFKNFGEQGWGLFDLQSLAVSMASSKNNNISVKKEDKNVSPFTDILSKAADDPSLKEKPVQPGQTVQKETIITRDVAKKDEPLPAGKVVQPVLPNETKDIPVKMYNESPERKDSVKKVQPLLTVKKESPVIKPAENQEGVIQAVYKPSMVTKKYETSTPEGIGLVYIDDFNNGYRDTISLIIPDPAKNETFSQNSKEELKFLEINTPVEQTAMPGKKEINSEGEPLSNRKPVTGNTCLNVADETDFYILRKRMAAGLSDKEMLTEATGYFKLKCFVTEQIKNLATLFLKEPGKYNFFEAAYPFVSDRSNFYSLELEFKEDYYIKKFKSLLLK